METYFAVESILSANYANADPDAVVMYIYGKGDEILLSDGDKNLNINHMTPFLVREYGYKRECDAKRSWAYRNPEVNRYWKAETRIVRLWVTKSGYVRIC